MKAGASKPVAVIMCGGLGERFWPATGTDLPKYALKFDQQKTLLAATYDRLRCVYPADHIFVITAAEHSALVKRLLPKLSPSRVLAEPMRKNTAGAVTYATLKLKKILGGDRVVSFFPADAMIKDETKFADCLRNVLAYSQASEEIAVIGVKPFYPATGYGYILRSKPLGPSWKSGYRVSEFTEKPPLKTAQRFLKAGGYYWNAGIFTWKISVFESAMSRCAPEYFDAFVRAFARGDSAVRAVFGRIESAPIDKLLVEKLDSLAVFCGNFDWDDIGTWDALRRIRTDASGNAIIASGVFEDMQNSVVVCEPGFKIVVAGVKGLAIVQNGHEILVCSLERSQHVGRLKRALHASRKSDRS